MPVLHVACDADVSRLRLHCPHHVYESITHVIDKKSLVDEVSIGKLNLCVNNNNSSRHNMGVSATRKRPKDSLDYLQQSEVTLGGILL